MLARVHGRMHVQPIWGYLLGRAIKASLSTRLYNYNKATRECQFAHLNELVRIKFLQLRRGETRAYPCGRPLAAKKDVCASSAKTMQA